jgi:hypothetical protein
VGLLLKSLLLETVAFERGVGPPGSLGGGVARKRQAPVRIRSARGRRSLLVPEEEPMVLIGMDPHKASHTAVVIDEDEPELAWVKVAALLEFADNYSPRRWAIESAGGLGFLLAGQLVRAGGGRRGRPGDVGREGATARVRAGLQERPERRTVDRDRGPARPTSAHRGGGRPGDGAAAAGRPAPRPDLAADPGGVSAARAARRADPRTGWDGGSPLPARLLGSARSTRPTASRPNASRWRWTWSATSAASMPRSKR